MAKKNNSLVPSYEKEFHSGSRWDFYKARRQKEALDNEKWDSFQRKRKRSREMREYAGGMLSRGIAIILCFVLLIFVFNILEPTFYGSENISVIRSGGSFDGSDVVLQSFRFNSSSSAFEAIEKSFSSVVGFCDDISSFFMRAFGVDYSVIFLFVNEENGLYNQREYIVVRGSPSLPVVHYDVSMSSVEDVVSYSWTLNGLITLYAADGSVLGGYSYYIENGLSDSMAYSYGFLSRCVRAGRLWVDSSIVLE